MPSTLSTFISPRVPSRSPRSQRKLYFPPGGHTHDRHTIPPDQLQISLSDPVLVAAEKRLSGQYPNWSNLLAVKHTDISRSGTDAIPMQSFRHRHLVHGAVDPKKMTSTDETSPLAGHTLKSGSRSCGPAAQDPSSLDSPDDSCDIVEVMSIEISLDDAASENRYSSTNISGTPTDGTSPHLAPLASDTFKEELYIRGYLRRPANVIPPRSRSTFKLISRNVFPRVLGRRHGRRIAASLKAEQDMAEAPRERDAHLSVPHPSAVASVALRPPHADSLESPGTDTTMAASESFDLHEFSYITAFTTPPSSPSVVLDADTFKRGACLNDSKHDV